VPPAYALTVIERRSNTDLIDTIVRELVEEFDPEEIILFGSHARGDAGPDSDLDLLVVVSESNETPTRRAARAHRRLARVPVATDIIVKTREEADRYRHLRASLVYTIYEEGTRIHG